MAAMLKATLFAYIFIVACTSFVASVSYSKEALLTEVRDLPGLTQKPNFRMFSGYIPLDPKQTTVEGDRALFYWFVESQRSPSSDPLVLWTNGGPGCSGLAGFMTEQGPFRPTANKTLVPNEHAWNKVANMVFIEQPAGVGFSYTKTAMNYTDEQAAKDNAAFIRGFLRRYTAYNKTELFITSESYGGHYMPTLAKELTVTAGACFTAADCPGSYCLDDPSKTYPYKCHTGEAVSPNFVGFMVGNPLTYMPYRDYGMYGTYAGHNLLPKPLFDQYLSAGCRTNDSSTVCQGLMSKMDTLTSGMDPYALDFPVCTSGTSAGRHERHTILKAMGRLPSYFPQTYTPCDANWATAYLNDPKVQHALGVQGQVTWAECSDTVSSKYSKTDVVLPMMPVYKWLFEHAPALRILVYSGDDDAVCATLGTQQWIWDLGLPVTSEWAPWSMNGQTSGFHVTFGETDSLSPELQFATVHGAGHMVPATRPAQSLQVLENYLNGKW